MAENLHDLGLELEWFGNALSDCLIRLGLHEGEPVNAPAPEQGPQAGRYGAFVSAHGLGEPERLALMLALLPHIKPDTLGALAQDEPCRRRLGLLQGRQFSGALPSLRTALVLLGGGNLKAELEALELFGPGQARQGESFAGGSLLARGVLRLGATLPEEPRSSAPLLVDDETLSRILTGRAFEPDSALSGRAFPAGKLESGLEWENLVLAPAVLRQLEDILAWAGHGGRLQSDLGLGAHLRPGYKALFYGPPGTGKTLTAALIGKRTGLPVYRVDLSQIVSKYIGETEKNLEQLFRLAENREWILFFDEADALFNKRTDVENSNDRHANQETAYLLQRLENFPGLVIMATNLQDNIDSAFTRRFNCGVFFPMPGRVERRQIWLSCLGRMRLTLQAEEWALEQELSGGQIANIALRLGLWKLRCGGLEVDENEVRRAVMLEQVLQGRG